jgi:hypothetical protein
MLKRIIGRCVGTGLATSLLVAATGVGIAQA